MKKIFLYLLLAATFCVRAQEDAWVYFTNKPDAEFYLSNPLEMLSQKALDRRAAQGIALDEIDVPLHQPYIDAITSANGIIVMARSKWLNALHVRGSEDAINTLAGFEFVDHVDFANKLLNTSGRPQQPLQQQTANKFLSVQADFNYGEASGQITMLNGQQLHQQDFTGTGMTIAVLDAGFPGVDTAAPFERLFDNGLILGGYDFVERSEAFYTANFHGTFVLSTMGGYVEGEYAGTAPDAFYYLFRTEDAGSENPVEESYWVEAAEVADSLGVDVINTSLGYFEYDNLAYSYTYEDMDGQTSFISRGSNIAFTRGMICVTSAGNTAASSHPHIGVPADAQNVLTVGAVNTEEVKSTFSSIGPSADGRIKPDIMAQGVSSAVSDTEGNITAASGTSFSSPITAGLVACLWQALPGKTNAEIVQLIKQSADRYNNPDNDYGYGIPDFGLALEIASVSQISKNKVMVYPNPANEIISVSGLDRDAEISFYNNLGQLVFNTNLRNNSTQAIVTSLKAGLYYYTITTAEGKYSGKLIKN